MDQKYIIVSNFEPVEEDNFYISEDWLKRADKNKKEIEEIQKNGER